MAELNGHDDLISMYRACLVKRLNEAAKYFLQHAAGLSEFEKDVIEEIVAKTGKICLK